MTDGVPAGERGWRQAGPYLLIFGLCLAVQAALAALKVPQVFDGELLGTDGYMRLVRVAGLHETGAWYDVTVARSNAPDGEVLHWTRPLDILLLAGAWVLTPVTGFRDALFFAGAVVSPLLWAFTGAAFVWAGEPFFGRSGRYLAMVAFLVQPAIMDYSLAGRADHHMLLLLIFVVSFGLTARMLLTPFHAGLALAAGAVVGLGLWVSFEFLLALLAAFAAMTLAWSMDSSDTTVIASFARSTSTAVTPGTSETSSLTDASQWPQVMPVIFRSVVVISCSSCGGGWATAPSHGDGPP